MNYQSRLAILAAVTVLAGCESNPMGPGAPRTADPAMERGEGTPTRSTYRPRWLTLREDGLYDDQGTRRMSRGRVNQVHLDRVFEQHRALKGLLIKARAEHGGNAQGHSSSYSSPMILKAPSAAANMLLTVNSRSVWHLQRVLV